MGWTELIKFTIAIIVITNAFGTIPIFLSLTADNTVEERKQIAIKSSISIAIIFITGILCGGFILQTFGISVDAFRVAGGIIIFMLGISMLNSKQSPIKHTKKEQRFAEQKDDIAIVPLALPIIAGPGTISTLIVYSNNYPELLDKIKLIGASLTIAVGFLLMLLSASKVSKYLGVSGIRIATRVMGMLLAALAIEMISTGLLKLFPGLH